MLTSFSAGGKFSVPPAIFPRQAAGPESDNPDKRNLWNENRR